MIKCEIIVSKIIIDGKLQTVYGLEFYRDNDKFPFKTVEDIYVELNMAEALKELINNNDVGESHIDDIIDDML